MIPEAPPGLYVLACSPARAPEPKAWLVHARPDPAKAAPLEPAEDSPIPSVVPPSPTVLSSFLGPFFLGTDPGYAALGTAQAKGLGCTSVRARMKGPPSLSPPGPCG